nr:hypothetical protein [Rhodococcus sp. (in: high G+C Gram-positive bacteria)]
MSALLTIVTGATLLTVVGIAFGGTFLLRINTGARGANALQKTFFRAGHAHAGVLVTLGLVVALVTTAAGVSDVWATVASIAVLSAAIFIPAGFFLSVLGSDPQKPGRAMASVWVGAATLTAGLVVAGVSTVAAGVGAL